MFFKFAFISILIGLTLSAPFSLHPSASELIQIEKQAGGTLPNGPLPTTLKSGAILDFQVIAANEIFEVAYFSSLLENVTNNKPGYTDFGGMGLNRDYVIKSLTQIVAQEKLHSIGANAILKNVGAKEIGPCLYNFPVEDFKSAISLAATFTDLVLGSLQAVQTDFALDGGEEAEGLVGLVGSIIGQEGEQDGAYRLIQQKVPSSAPFLTGSAGQFAFNALKQNFIIPNSCSPSSNFEEIKIPSFATLKITKDSIKPNGEKDVLLTFETTETKSVQGKFIAYISGKNKPVVVPIKNEKHFDGKCIFQADFPFSSKQFSKGLTIAAIIEKDDSNFSKPSDIAAVTIAGPALIEVE